ncbi:aminotransferase class I/II-fold pyridoxal phosphate-dependent enzyme [Sphingomonas crusticola]|uniref:aminotransferase class I/II-fold pyridoxal phosphate-dependent enzyme n=1 Tax=Sphingomonas crusticola TaxID=1697973 RepID=UPI000E24939E|nr:aminotransferase class I/II-fold pyridoxal phosphate-dependent enzyme [Sphingomonas crusticola]
MTSPPRLYLSPPHMGTREQALVGEAFASNWIAPIGPMIDLFEAKLAELTGIGHVVALSSGTAALHLALRLSGIGPGDVVWGSTMTFIGGVAPILYMGAAPLFLDIERDGFLLDLDLLEEALETRADKPKVVITTDLYGHVVDAVRVRALADRFGFIWISDAAEAVGAYRDGVHAGKGADFTILSFNGNKIITTSGGGALASENGEAIARARFLSTQAREPAAHYEHETYGYNYRLSNVCAAIGVGQLEVLADRVAARRAIFAAYRSSLGDMPGVAFVGEPAGMAANRWLTTITIDPAEAGFDREEAQAALERENIESRPLWKPMHLQPLFRDAACIAGGVAERMFERGLCLPSGSAMDEADVARVCAILARQAG